MMTFARLPLVVIDGKPFTWEQVGHMLMTFEGFTLEAWVNDPIEVLGDRGLNSLPGQKPDARGHAFRPCDAILLST